MLPYTWVGKLGKLQALAATLGKISSFPAGKGRGSQILGFVGIPQKRHGTCQQWCSSVTLFV